jgi:hypothetical protein
LPILGNDDRKYTSKEETRLTSRKEKSSKAALQQSNNSKRQIHELFDGSSKIIKNDKKQSTSTQRIINLVTPSPSPNKNKYNHKSPKRPVEIPKVVVKSLIATSSASNVAGNKRKREENHEGQKSHARKKSKKE